MSEAVRSRWANHAESVLQDAGQRRGSARAAVIDLLAREPCALTSFDIEERLRGRGQRPVSRSSIYRILELLHEHGLIQRLELGHGVTHYEVVDPTGDHHHHVVCDRCGMLMPFDDSGLERSLDRLAKRLNFAVSDHEVVLHGACSRCASPAPS